MNNELIGEIKDDSLNVMVQITESGPRGLPGPPGLPGTTNYNDLTNKPRIESVELIGNKTLDEIGIRTITETEIGLLF
jgi:hypothetical protein